MGPTLVREVSWFDRRRVCVCVCAYARLVKFLESRFNHTDQSSFWANPEVGHKPSVGQKVV